MKKLFAIIFTTLVFSIAAAAQKLPEIATPHHYILTLAPDLKSETFTGDEVIHGDILKPTNNIVLNALEIEFQDVTIQALPAAKGGKPGEVQKATVSLDPQSEMATLMTLTRSCTSSLHWQNEVSYLEELHVGRTKSLDFGRSSPDRLLSHGSGWFHAAVERGEIAAGSAYEQHLLPRSEARREYAQIHTLGGDLYSEHQTRR